MIVLYRSQIIAPLISTFLRWNQNVATLSVTILHRLAQHAIKPVLQAKDRACDLLIRVPQLSAARQHQVD